MKELIVALLAGGIGTAMLLVGYRMARIIIPLWGLIAGFMLGASAVSDALSNNFIGSVMGVVVGFIVGVVFALFAYFFFELAIVLLGANVGYWIGVSLIGLFGIEKGFLSAVVGIMLGVIFALVFLFANAPKIFLIIFTSLGGASAIITALLLLFDKVQIDNLSYISVNNSINNAWLWSLVGLILLAGGIIYQFTMNKKYELNEWRALADIVDEPVNK
jgi:hypothetical protein